MIYHWPSTKTGSDRLNWIGLQIVFDSGSDPTGIFAFGAEELFFNDDTGGSEEEMRVFTTEV